MIQSASYAKPILHVGGMLVYYKHHTSEKKNQFMKLKNKNKLLKNKFD